MGAQEGCLEEETFKPKLKWVGVRQIKNGERFLKEQYMEWPGGKKKRRTSGELKDSQHCCKGGWYGWSGWIGGGNMERTGRIRHLLHAKCPCNSVIISSNLILILQRRVFTFYINKERVLTPLTCPQIIHLIVYLGVCLMLKSVPCPCIQSLRAEYLALLNFRTHKYFLSIPTRDGFIKEFSLASMLMNFIFRGDAPSRCLGT